MDSKIKEFLYRAIEQKAFNFRIACGEEGSACIQLLCKVMECYEELKDHELEAISHWFMYRYNPSMKKQITSEQGKEGV